MKISAYTQLSQFITFFILLLVVLSLYFHIVQSLQKCKCFHSQIWTKMLHYMVLPMDVFFPTGLYAHLPCQRLSAHFEKPWACEGEIYERSVRHEPSHEDFNKNLSKIQLQLQKLINLSVGTEQKFVNLSIPLFPLSLPSISFWPRSITLLVNSFYTCSNNCSS